MPAIPLIATIGSGVAAAAPVIAAGAGIYSAVKGAQAQKDAAAAVQNQATAAGQGAPLANSAAAQEQALQSYFNSNPLFSAEYQRNRSATGDPRSPTQWLYDHLNANPGEMETFKQFSVQSGALPSSVAGPGGTVDIGAAQSVAQAIARQNAATSAELERQYNPGAAELRSAGLQGVTSLLERGAQPIVGTLPTVGNAPVSAANQDMLGRVTTLAGQPIATGYDSPLTRAAIARAQEDLALGGILPQDVAQLVARRAFARAGTVGNIRLGGDISTRDLGLTSLDLRNQRLAQALQAGGAETALEQGNATLAYNAELARRQGLLAAQQATAQDQAAQQAAYFNKLAQESSNYFNQNQLAQSIASGEFGRNLAAAQLGQNIPAPMAGLDPGSVVNLAVGNVNQASNSQQQANAAAQQAAQQRTQFGSQLIGAAINPALDALKSFAAPKPTTYGTYVPPASSYISGIIPGFA